MSGAKGWISTVILVMVCLSIYKANNGDVTKMVDAVWAILNKGADIITGLWHKFMSLSTG